MSLIMDDACVQCGSPCGFCECEYQDRKLTQLYQCNYCGFTGSSMHSCVEYIKTLKIYKEMKG